MSLVGEQVLLRAYLQSADRAPHMPTWERLVKAAREEGLAGATVLDGIMGFGSRGLIQHAKWSVVQHVPIIVEMVDSAERIGSFIQGPLDSIMIQGLLTLERASVMMYRQRQHDQPNRLHLATPQKPLSTIPRIQSRPHMTINENGVLLRVFVGEGDTADAKPLYEAVLHKARELGLSGGTVLRGVEGFGANSIVHKAKLLEMSSDLPIVIEMVDSEEKIGRLLLYLEQVVQEGMITMEHVAIVFYRHNPRDGAAAARN